MHLLPVNEVLSARHRDKREAKRMRSVQLVSHGLRMRIIRIIRGEKDDDDDDIDDQHRHHHYSSSFIVMLLITTLQKANEQ